MTEPTFIYAYKSPSGEFLYVGQSIEPDRRQRQHNSNGSKIKPLLPADAQFCILRKTNTKESSRIETQIIQALKRRGQARLNQRTRCTPVEQLFTTATHKARILKRERAVYETTEHFKIAEQIAWTDSEIWEALPLETLRQIADLAGIERN